MLKPINKNDSQTLAKYVSERIQEISADILLTATDIIEQVRTQGDDASNEVADRKRAEVEEIIS